MTGCVLLLLYWFSYSHRPLPECGWVVCSEVAEAARESLKSLHAAGVVHRDIRAQNLLVVHGKVRSLHVSCCQGSLLWPPDACV